MSVVVQDLHPGIYSSPSGSERVLVFTVKPIENKIRVKYQWLTGSDRNQIHEVTLNPEGNWRLDPEPYVINEWSL